MALSITLVTLDPLSQAADQFTFLPSRPLALYPIHALPPPVANGTTNVTEPTPIEECVHMCSYADLWAGFTQGNTR